MSKSQDMYMYTKELEELLKISVKINEKSPEGFTEKFAYSFSSILLAFMIAKDPISLWFQNYVNKNKIDIKKILEFKKIDYTAWQNITKNDTHIRASEIEKWTSTAMDVMTIAKKYANQLNKIQFQDIKQFNQQTVLLDVRHIMAVYIYGDYGNIHKKQITDWGFNRKEMSESFIDRLSQLQKPLSEIEYWSNLHKKEFKEEAIISQNNKELETSIKLSKTLKSIVNDLNNKKVNSIDIVDLINSYHDDYAKGRAKKLNLKIYTNNFPVKRPINEWLTEIQQIYNISEIYKNNKVLDDRLTILGLSLIDSDLLQILKKESFIDLIIEEIKSHLKIRKIDSIMSEKGIRLFKNKYDKIIDNSTNLEVPIHSDAPTNIDLLNRQLFVEALAMRLNRFWDLMNEKDGAFIMNIDGPWGAGKTTLLKLLKTELEKEKPETKKWIVIEFNAWQHHRTAKSWWFLMDTICKELPNKLWEYKFRRKSVYIKIIDKFWRILTGKWSRLLLISTVILFFIGIGFFLGIFDNVISSKPDGSTSSAITNPLYTFFDKNVAAIITLVSSLITGIYGIKNSLFPGSETDLKNVLESIDDPTEKIKNQFNRIIEKIKEQPIIVFIDDLDRCKEDYVVEFLEGIQTLFKESNIFFVIASDRRWLYSSYEKIYENFKGTISEPGRPLRYLFLDKVFQLTFPVPGIDPELQKVFFNHLLTKTSNQELKESFNEAVERVKEKFVGKKTENEIINTSRNRVSDPSKTEEENVIETVAYRGVAALQISNSEVIKDLEHKLLPFAPLIDSNPRFMKKLVNTYGLFRSIEIIRNGGEMRFEKLALWVILSLRWPLLSDYLQLHPEKVALIGKDDLKDIPDNLHPLFKDKKVEEVVFCYNLDNVKPTFLDEYTIREIVGK